MLTFCPTPIGNIEDITLRALSAIARANVIICEDTRVTKRLLSLFLEHDLIKQYFSALFCEKKNS
ncbi:MAG: SAM-dependent methyltransferase [Helicobacter sp.]|nr:SAM-dependent methyltransferase [Helicobacter sp.]